MDIKPVYKKSHGQYGLRVPSIYIPELFESAEKYIPEEDDIIVASYPECGAEWVSHIVFLILRIGKPCTTGDEYFRNVPLLEMVGSERLKYIPRPRCIRTHLPFSYRYYSSKSKYIFIIRNPADCVKSLYQRTKTFPYFFFHNGTFDTFFDLFIKGEVGYDDYFNHFHSWYAARLNSNVLFITYESLVSDLKENIQKIAGFLDEKYRNSLVKSGGKLLNEICFSSCLSVWKYTFHEYWREILIENPPTDSCHCMLPVIKEYALLKQKARVDGALWEEELTWEEEENLELLKRHETELKRYISYNIYEEEYWRLEYFERKTNILY